MSATLIILTTAFIILFWFFYTKFFGAEYQAVPTRVLKKMIESAGLKKKDVVYDLGCGNGKILLEAAKFCKKARGIEIDPLRVLMARMKTGKMNNVEVIRGNLFRQNLRDANVIFIFLRQRTNDKLMEKFRKELKKGTKIISHYWTLDLKPFKVDKKLRVYEYKI